MSNEIIEVKAELMSVSSQDVQHLSTHLGAIKEFVSNQLKEGINSDYAVIPGTKKRALLKPGAEKLMKLFGFSSRVECVEKTISPEENFAMFTYKATIIHIKTGTTISECEGICNNFEDKYREKKAWVKGVESKEPVNVMNILNTLMKMAQKRALIGAVILATGASDYFTQDEDEILAQKKEKNRPVDDSKFTSAEQDGDLASYVVTIGKHKGKTFAEIGSKDLENYLNWMSKNQSNPTGPMLDVLNKGREFLRMGA